MAERKRCCVNCGDNNRLEGPDGINCHCEIDGHWIECIETFEGWCRRWKKDHTFDREREDA